MDTLMISELLFLYAVVLTSTKVTTALRILVTKQSCGETVDLAQERNVYLDYEGAELGGILETCEIKIQNSSPDEMICIKTHNSYSGYNADINCLMALKYYVEYERYSSNYLNCYDFNRQPRCDRANETRAVFQSFFIIRGSSVRVNLHIYLGKDSPAPTTTRDTRNYWSSWSSWSPSSSWSSWSSNSDDDTSSSRLGTGSLVGIVVGVISVAFVCLLCIKWCNAKAKKPDLRYSTGAVQYQAATAGLNYPHQSQGAAGTSLLPQGNQGNQQYTSNPSSQPLMNKPAISNQYPGYQIHPPVYQSASSSPETFTYPQQMSNIIPSAPHEDDIPNIPPPAYPGY